MFGGPISLFELVTGVAVFWLVRRFFLGLPPDWEPVGTRKFPILLVVDGATSEERESHPVLLARIRSEVHSGEERRRRDHEAAGAPFMLWRFYCYFLSCNLTAFSAKFAASFLVVAPSPTTPRRPKLAAAARVRSIPAFPPRLFAVGRILDHRNLDQTTPW
jgi:hypothetical protein